MDQYGARGELIAAQHDTILGPFLVASGTDRAVQFNLDGTDTIYEHGRTYTRPAHKITDDRYKLTRDEWASCMADHFYCGFYHDFPEAFDEEYARMMSSKCRGTLSDDWKEWLSWARGIVMLPVRINSAKVA